jgi:uncharacterized protein (TIGR03437 family)
MIAEVSGMPGLVRSVWLAIALAATCVAQDEASPELSAANIVSAADYRGGAVAPSEIVVLYPGHAGPPEMIPWALDAAHMSQYSVDSLGGTRVLFDGKAAPIVYAKSGQICAIVPYAVSGKRSTEVVVEYEGRRSSPVDVPVVASIPALFTLDASGSGQAAMLNETGCCNSLRNPAMRGTVVSLYATGDGSPLPGAKGLAGPLPVKVTVGGIPAQVVWTGNVGVLQVNVRIPANAPVGDAVPLVLTIGNAHSTSDVTMAIRSARQQILVVASHPALGRRLSAILTGAGYDVLAAPDASQAEDAARRHNVDLVISDLARPGDENRQMMTDIRALRLQVRTLAFADSLNDETLKAADLLGAQGVLTRGLTAQVMLEKVRALLRRKPAVY